jgi:hypothetical protein
LLRLLLAAEHSRVRRSRSSRASAWAASAASASSRRLGSGPDLRVLLRDRAVIVAHRRRLLLLRLLLLLLLVVCDRRLHRLHLLLRGLHPLVVHGLLGPLLHVLHTGLHRLLEVLSGGNGNEEQGGERTNSEFERRKLTEVIPAASGSSHSPTWEPR